jgi:hypothetical protein
MACSPLCIPSSKRQRLETPKVVLCWDLDETLLIFNSLLTGLWATSHGYTSAQKLKAQGLGKEMINAILSISDEKFMFKEAS